MIELTQQQVHALENPETTPPLVVNPPDKGDFRLAPRGGIRASEGGGIRRQSLDKGRAQALAWERIKHEDWEEYDDVPEKP